MISLFKKKKERNFLGVIKFIFIVLLDVEFFRIFYEFLDTVLIDFGGWFASVVNLIY